VKRYVFVFVREDALSILITHCAVLELQFSQNAVLKQHIRNNQKRFCKMC